MFHYLTAMSFKEGLGCIEHGIVSLSGRIREIAPGPQLFHHFQGVAGFEQQGFYLRSEVHRAIPSLATLR